MLIKAEEIMNILGVSKATAYRIIKELNNTLNNKGFRTINGKTSKKIFYENYFLDIPSEVNHVSLQR